MNIITKVKKNKTAQKYYDIIINSYYSLLTLLSPTLNTKARYKRVFGRTLNLENPTTFNEKLLWLKLNKYNNDPLVIQCADKYRVREYVAKLGFSSLLNNLYGVYDSETEINWDELPTCFVLKWNFGAGFNIICKNKKELDIESSMKKLHKWSKVKYWLSHSEMQYKKAPKKIICEEFLENHDEPGVIPDYKVYCFHGNPKAILVMHDRGRDLKTEFFDINWNLLENTNKYHQVDVHTSKPDCLKEMLDAARALAKPFPFVRCDFYIVNGKLYFGELTFTPAGGLYVSQTKIDGKEMTDYLNLEDI